MRVFLRSKNHLIAFQRSGRFYNRLLRKFVPTFYATFRGGRNLSGVILYHKTGLNFHSLRKSFMYLLPLSYYIIPSGKKAVMSLRAANLCISSRKRRTTIHNMPFSLDMQQLTAVMLVTLHTSRKNTYAFGQISVCAVQYKKSA